MSDKMRNLVVRSASGLVLGIVMLGAILWTRWSYALLFLLLLWGGLYEFYILAREQGNAPQRVLGAVAGTVLFALNMALASENEAVYKFIGGLHGLFVCGGVFLLLIVPLMFVCELYRKQEQPVANVGSTLAGVCYVAVPFSLLCYLPGIAGGWNPWVVVAYLFIVWANDVFAYLVGMTLGRHKLFERLSPKKSWEGFFGGLAGAVATGLVAGGLLGDSLAVWAGLALVAAVTGVLGDLAESMFKRAAKVKDSGALIPGHGGVLDRFDALMFSAPFVFAYMLFVM